MRSFLVFSLSARAALAALCLFAVTLAGCTTHEGVLLPMGQTVPGASTVNMLVATTRAPSPNPGVLFSGQRGSGVSVDNIVVSIPPDQNRKIGEVAWPEHVPGDPAKDFTVVSAERVDVEGAQAWYRSVAGRHRRVLIFVHGFNNRYEESVFRFAQIVHDSGTDAAPILFTWPSGASVFDYNYDRESANYSRGALEQLLTLAAADPNVDDVTVMAHSMGSWLTMEALRQLAIRQGKVPAKIQNVILASPDLDVDVFKKQLEEIDTHHLKITLFISRDDRALALSRRIAGGVDRLGAIDPTQEPYRTELETAGITVLDLSALRAGDRLNHGKFAASPAVVRLIGQRLIAGQKVTDADVGLGERIGAATLGTAQTVGSAAGAVATLPIAVFVPGARKGLQNQVESIGRNLGGTLQTAVGQ
ncbi:alpha/beta hydrolase [Consotaella salsifontis]|uniref:Esterase/lipase superfamily enzyme n=1 Tax=Consotaella salsifontis TaxID=1365950 RepID=A0A1T4PX39_9HYPH|nr:alpha/beta hydrolase [Consotaella salsifontis]SJZ95791.1 Esterase/lipase superfamily enzyme [Consotaella salsifontis]